jgi:hypothetical protein
MVTKPVTGTPFANTLHTHCLCIVLARFPKLADRSINTAHVTVWSNKIWQLNVTYALYCKSTSYNSFWGFFWYRHFPFLIRTNTYSPLPPSSLPLLNLKKNDPPHTVHTHTHILHLWTKTLFAIIGWSCSGARPHTQIMCIYTLSMFPARYKQNGINTCMRVCMYVQSPYIVLYACKVEHATMKVYIQWSKTGILPRNWH